MPHPDRPIRGSHLIERAIALRAAGCETELFGADPRIFGVLDRSLERLRGRDHRPTDYRIRDVRVTAPRTRWTLPAPLRGILGSVVPEAVDDWDEHTLATALVRTIERDRPDVVVGHGVLSWAEILQHATWATGVPHAFIEDSAVDLLTVLPGTRAHERGRVATERAKAVFVVGPQMLEHARDVLGWQRVSLLPDGARPMSADAPPRPASLEGRTIVLAAGDYQRRRGYEELIDALPVVLERHPSVEVHVVTNAPPSLRRRAESRIPAGRVHFHDPMPGDGLLHFMSWSDLFVLPSRDEGFGSVYAEALRYGCSVIATEDSGFARYCTRYEREFGRRPATTVLPGDTTGLRAALGALLEDHTRARSEREAGRDMVARWFSWRSNAELLRDTLFGPVEPRVIDRPTPRLPEPRNCLLTSRASIRSSEPNPTP